MKDLLERAIATPPLQVLKGLTSAYVAYPLAEHWEKRDIQAKILKLRKYFSAPFEKRLKLSIENLIRILEHAKSNVPYYRELFHSVNFQPDKLRRDPSYLNDLPFLTKDIILDQKQRLLSRPLEEIRHYVCKTGGSTGPSCIIYYDQEAVDYSSAVTIYARERIGKSKYKSELHFACRFPDIAQSPMFGRETFKCFAMNRSNIFFDRLDNAGIEEIWRTLKRRRPFLVHAHPSTIYSLACYIKHKYGSGKAFNIFESSGELLESYQRDLISHVLQCSVINRYGSAEFGVIAYELNGENGGMQVLESEGWPESHNFFDNDRSVNELIFTGYRNKLMPLIRYRTGDLAKVETRTNGYFLTNIVGRIHDMVPINGILHPTHHVQDMLDHRIGGIQEFQIDLRTEPPTLKIVPELSANTDFIRKKINQYWGSGFVAEFVSHADFVRVGRHAKFRHVVQP